MKFNKLIHQMNEHFKEETGKRYPLASGNCVLFANALSKYLTKHDIAHGIVNYTFSYMCLGEVHDVMDIKDLIKNKVKCLHMAVSITDDKFVDFLGINSRRFIEEDMNIHDVPELRFSRIINYDPFYLEKYSNLFTCSWLLQEDFDNYIKNNWPH